MSGYKLIYVHAAIYNMASLKGLEFCVAQLSALRDGLI
jgi:hypothetical protein